MTTSAEQNNPFPSVSSHQLHQQLSEGAQLVTSNQRLSRYRLQQFESQQQRLGKTSWPTPQILPWSSWIELQWQKAKLGAYLTTAQESLLWQTTILEDQETEVLNPKALSKQAMEAWKILSDFQISPDCLRHAGEEHRALWRWGNSVLQKSALAFSHQMVELLTQTSAQAVPHTVILDGFDTLTPLQLKYLNKLAALECMIFSVKPDYPAAERKVTVYSDDSAELRGVCHQIRQSLSQAGDKSIAVLVPNLEQRAQHVSRILGEELAPELSLHLKGDAQGDYFNLSLGSPLAKQPMIQTAFLLLSLIQKEQLRHDVFSNLLLNPYIAGFEAEQQQRAVLDKKFRTSNQFFLNVKEFTTFCGQNSDDTPQLMTLLQQLMELKQSKKLNRKQFMSSWMIRIEQALTSLQWQEQCRQHNDHAQLQSWQELTSKLTQLDDFCGNVSWPEALSLLMEHALEQVFRPAPSQANIQVMGLLEAANLRFDEAYIIGMDDLNWPPTAKPHPLIPFDIQVLHQTPHANSEREWQYAQSVWSNLQYIAPIIRISYARSINNQEVQASSLLQDSAISEPLPITSVRYPFTLQQHGAELEAVNGESVPVTEDEIIRGGTGIIKAEALCAFQAFATYRLQLKPLEIAGNGLNAAEQGTLLHRVLELFWKETGTQQEQLKLDEQQLSDTLHRLIRSSWDQIERPVPEQTKTLEEKRLEQLLMQWLKLEALRQPFKVEAFEEWRNITLGTQKKLTLHTKIDRIDQDSFGNRIIIDYKSGETSTGKAIGESLTEPQLPIYFLAEQARQQEPQAITFAQVKNGAMSFKGFAQEKDILPDMRAYKGRGEQPADWDELTSEWRETLNALADEFLEGAADVFPKSSQSCHYCQLEGVCRIQQQEIHQDND